MAFTRLTVVSDSHLSELTPEATENWDALIGHVDTVQPDAIVHTGDIARDGTAGGAELVFARRALDRMGDTVLALPGNHDLGDNPCETNAGSPHLVTSDRVAAYRDHVGPDRWSVDVGPWRLVGLNAQLLGSGAETAEDSGLADDIAEQSGLADDIADQWAWLETELVPERFTDHHPAIFLHKPLWHSDPQPAEHDEPIRYVRPDARQRLTALLERVGAKVVVSGHVHQHRHTQARGMDHVWAPTAWATLPEAMQATIGERWVGALDLILDDDGSVTVNPVRPAGVHQHIIGETIPNPY